MVQEHKTPAKTKTAEPEPEVEVRKDLQNEELAGDIENVLDEIDELIGEVGEEFALSYVQAGGE